MRIKICRKEAKESSCWLQLIERIPVIKIQTTKESQIADFVLLIWNFPP